MIPVQKPPYAAEIEGQPGRDEVDHDNPGRDGEDQAAACHPGS
jgi:hypothetical protein